MNSKHILLKIPASKPDSKKSKESNERKHNYKDYEDYLGSKNFEILKKNDRNNFLERNQLRMSFVLRRITASGCRRYYAKELFHVYEELFKPFLPPELEHLQTNEVRIRQNLENFFELQRGYNTVMSVSSVLNFHTIFLNFVGVYFLPLVAKENLYIHQEIYSISSNIYTENENVFNFAKKYIQQYDVELIRANPPPPPPKTNDVDALILEFLQTVFNNLIKKLQKKKVSTDNKECKFLTYGSYTTYEINPEITYNDIDIYMSNPLSLLVTFLVVIKITLNIDVEIFKIPLVIGHVSLQYKGKHFTDCLYMDDKTITDVPTVVIKEITFVHPLIQILNLFRMMSELRRMSALSETPETRLNTEKKVSALLQYACEAYDIDVINDLTPFNLNVNHRNNAFIIELIPLFKQIKTYDNLKDQLDIDYLITLKHAPGMFLKVVGKTNPIIRKQWFALFNEIVAEYHNKKPIPPKIKKGKKQLNKIIIREEDIKCNRPKPTDDDEDINALLNLVNNNNIVLMSNFTTDFYIKTYENKHNVIEDEEVSTISKETILSSFVLSQILTNFENRELVRFYFLFLLSYISATNETNDKREELMLLSSMKSNKGLSMSTYKKNKLRGEHETFGLVPIPRLKNLFFYKKQEEWVYRNYQQFLDVTMYN